MATNRSAEEEVWAGEIEYWDAIKAFDLDRYARLWHDAVIGWPNTQLVPLNKSAIVELIRGALDALQPGSIEVQLRRLSVHVVADVGIAHLQVNAHAITRAGAQFDYGERITHTWLRTADRWKILGGMSAPIAGAGGSSDSANDA